MATTRYARAKKVLWLPALWAAAGALPGAYIGTVAAMHLGSEIMTAFMVFAIPVIGVFVVLRRNDSVEPRPITRRTYLICLIIGLIIGSLVGMLVTAMSYAAKHEDEASDRWYEEHRGD
jgi:uncharacterized membrane protein YfcA